MEDVVQRSVQGFVAGFSVLVIGLIAGDLSPVRAQGGTFADAGQAALYTEKVGPIFEARCVHPVIEDRRHLAAGVSGSISIYINTQI